jgi:hypothetical protein
MLHKNALWVGLLLGLLLPILTYTILLQIFSLLEIKGAASGATNLFLLSTYRRRRWELTMRGVVIATTLLAFAWLYVYGLKLF